MDITDGSLDVSAEVEIETTNLRECQECGYTTVNKSNLNKHMRRRHTVPKTSTPVKPPATDVPLDLFICDTCGKTYKCKFGLDLHVKSKHKMDFKYVCQVCDKGFNQRIQFRFHVSSHSSLGMDKCKFCKAEFQASGSLKRHLDACHEKPDRFICDVCQKTFACKYKRDEHHRGKHGEKRYSCQHCGKRFGWRSSLKAHDSRCQK